MSPPARRPLATGSWSSSCAGAVVVVVVGGSELLPGTVVAGSVVEPQVPSNRPVDTAIAATDSMCSTPQRRTGPWTAADYRAGWARDSGARNGQEIAHLWLRSRRIDRSRSLHRLPWASGRRPRGRPSVSHSAAGGTDVSVSPSIAAASIGVSPSMRYGRLSTVTNDVAPPSVELKLSTNTSRPSWCTASDV